MKTKRFISTALTLALIATAVPNATISDAATKAPSISKTKLTINAGKKAALTIKKGSAKIKIVKWSSTNKKAAKVTKKTALKAVVKGVKKGNATIKAVVVSFAV